MRRRKRQPRVSREYARKLVRAIIEIVDLSPRAIKMLTLITGVADGRHWSWNDAAEELDLSDEQEQAVEAEMFAKFTMLEIGVACGHLKQQVLDEMKKS